MIIDTFPFHQELDLLELRLHELDGVVDHFVLCEAPFTHSGKPKPLYFEENKARFQRFLPKITHLVARDFPRADFPKLGESWKYERHQRDWISGALEGLADTDIVIHGDADEIASAAAVKSYRPEMGFMGLDMSMHAYRLNLTTREEPYGWSKIFAYGHLRAIEPWTMCKVRYLVTKSIQDGGWHFSFMGSEAEVVEKIEAWGHQEYNTPERKDHIRIRRDMALGIDPHGRQARYREEPLDDRYPAWLRANAHRFMHLLVSAPVVPAIEPRTVEWNKKVWDSYAWPKDGDEWSEMADSCGVPYETWKASLVKTFLAPYLGTEKCAVEIGPGHGRWTALIAPKVRHLTVVDVSEKCLRFCMNRFESRGNISYCLDGSKDPAKGWDTFAGSKLKGYADFIWSFDTFVHVEEPELRAYVKDFALIMKPSAMGVIHHAGTPTPEQRAAGCRSGLSGPLVARILRENGFFVIRQTDAWEGGNVKLNNDLLTVFAKP